jgi:hypothetical protein
LCDGTSARVLSPAFGGRRGSPLRVAVAGRGGLIVTVLTAAGARVYRHLVRPGSRAAVVVVDARRLARGVYRIVVAGRRSRLGLPVVLGAARI